MSSKITLSKPTYSLEHCAMSVAIESFSLASVMTAMGKFLPSIGASFKQTTDHGLADLRSITPKDTVPKEFRNALKSLDVFRFIDLRDTPIFVPDGFTGSLTEYAQQLRQSVAMCREIAQCIADYKAYMGMAVSNERVRIDTKEHGIKWLTLSDKSQKHKAAVDAYFTDKPTTFLPLGDVFGNFGEINTFFKTVSSLSLDIGQLNPKALVTDVETASTYLDMFAKNYEEGKYKEISAQAAKSIALGAHQVATLSECYSILYYRMLGLGKAAEQIKQKLETIAKA
jgi:hypothetical protein